MIKRLLTKSDDHQLTIIHEKLPANEHTEIKIDHEEPDGVIADHKNSF
jgi:hypothetical protein